MRRGDIFLADLDPSTGKYTVSKGSEQAGRRPVLVFQDDRLIPATLTVVVIPLTSNLRMQKLPTCVLIPQGEGGLRQDSVAICHQIRALDKQGLVENWGRVSQERLLAVERVVLRTLGIQP
jgi:mRNA interferase MazF